MSNHKTNKKLNSFLKEKISVRLQAIEGMKEVKVLDCFHAEGELWNNVRRFKRIDNLLGIEKNKHLKSIDKTIYGNNLNVMREINLDDFNVIDLDAYGSPLEQMEVVFTRCNEPKVVIYTFCYNGLSGVPKIMSCCWEIQEHCKTILNPYFDDLFKNYLYKHGIKEYYEIEKVSTGFRKKYGYFYYNPLQKR